MTTSILLVSMFVLLAIGVPIGVCLALPILLMIAMDQSPLLCNTGLPVYSWSRYSSTSSSSISPRICLSSAWKNRPWSSSSS